MGSRSAKPSSKSTWAAHCPVSERYWGHWGRQRAPKSKCCEWKWYGLFCTSTYHNCHLAWVSPRLPANAGRSSSPGSRGCSDCVDNQLAPVDHYNAATRRSFKYHCKYSSSSDDGTSTSARNEQTPASVSSTWSRRGRSLAKFCHSSPPGRR